MAAIKYFGVSIIENDTESRAIRLHDDATNLDSMDIPSTVKVLHVVGAPEISSKEYAQRLLQVATLLQASVGIHSIKFVHCQLAEIAQFIYLATRRQRQGPLLSMEFQECQFKFGAAISLQFLLKYGLIQKLALLDCSFHDDETSDIIADGLRVNRSLQKFALDWQRVEPPESLMKSLYEMLKANKSIFPLGVNMTNQNVWDLYTAIETSPKLQCLQISAATFAREDLGSISMMCFAMRNLKSIYFFGCKFSPDGLKFLVDQLSKHVAICDLQLAKCQIQSAAANLPPLEVNWGGLNTQRLMFPDTRLGKDATFKLIDDLATNSRVKYLDLRSVLLTVEEFNKMCDVFLRQNKGPSELLLNGFAACTPMMVDAFHQNTSVTRLMIETMDSNALVIFVQGLANMRGLRHLTIGNLHASAATVVYTKTFFEVLEASMRDNTTLWGIALAGTDRNSDMVKAHLPMINYYVAINRVGRHRALSTANIPSGIWAHILAKSSTEPNGLFFVLTGKPDLIVILPTRPRRHYHQVGSATEPKASEQEEEGE